VAEIVGQEDRRHPTAAKLALEGVVALEGFDPRLGEKGQGALLVG